ncbi:MAG: dihydrofolate reductase [Euryarchaeota archaeon]|nr:dihydrofolate reductase [Euryarchaeota archaeon]|tara:strand:+ start:87 stop:596 length:510 start_codon:yes stop_codon:yes gene_type:complete
MKMSIIVAMDEGGAIGTEGHLPWKLKSDMERFRKLTEGDGFNSVIMGRKTWDSLPRTFRPLPKRVNIVMSRDTEWSDEGSITALYVGRAIEIAFAEGSEECWIIGGSQIYEAFLDRVDEIHVTEVHTEGSGDVKFPEWKKSDWNREIIENVEPDDENEYASTYSIWTKV